MLEICYPIQIDSLYIGKVQQDFVEIVGPNVKYSLGKQLSVLQNAKYFHENDIVRGLMYNSQYHPFSAPFVDHCLQATGCAMSEMEAVGVTHSSNTSNQKLNV